MNTSGANGEPPSTQPGGGEETLSADFTLHRERLWRMVRFRMDRRLAGRVDPDDVLQEAYLDAVKRITHRDDSTPESRFLWLRMIVMQTLIDVHRRHMETEMRDARRDVSMQLAVNPQATSVCLAVQLAGSMTSPSRAAQRDETMRVLVAALATMEPIDQEVIALRHFEDLTNGEVAVALGLKPTAASNRYVRAIARLRSVLESIPAIRTGETEPADGD